MILILASQFDAGAASLVRRWHDCDARVLTCRDLGTAGWVFDPEDPIAGSLALAGSVIPTSEVSAIVTLLPLAWATEFPHIRAEDRSYVAGEVNAFLIAWLSSLGSRVLNPPSPLNLTGPELQPAEWIAAAAHAGLAIRPWSGTADAEPGFTGAADAEVLEVVTVVAGAVVAPGKSGHLPAETRRQLCELAKNVGAGLMSATLTASGRPLFVGATAGADVSRDGVADALHTALAGAR